MTDLEILKRVIDTLDNIEIPAKYVEKIGIPISNCSNLLKALDKAVKDTMKRNQQEQPAEAVPETEEPEEPEEPEEN